MKSKKANRAVEKPIDPDRLLEISYEVLDWVCTQLKCEPRKAKCDECVLGKKHNNIEYHHTMKWSLLQKEVKEFYESRHDWVKRVRESRKPKPEDDLELSYTGIGRWRVRRRKN